MATARKSIKLRWGLATVTTTNMVESFNLITDLIDDCGMTRLTNEEFSGQAGLFVEEDPDEGETVPEVVTSGTFVTIGYNVWKHPKKELYLKVNYINHGNGSDRAGVCVSFDIGTEILNGEFKGETINVRPLAQTQTSQSSTYRINTNSLITKQLDCFAYMDDECFWVCSEPQVITLDSNTNSSNRFLTKAPTNISPLGFGVFYDDQNNLSVIYSQLVQTSTYTSSLNGTNIYGYFGGTTESFIGQRTIRAYLKEVDGPFNFQKGFPLCTFNNVGVASDEQGVRVTQAQAIFDSKIKKLNFGFMNGNAATDLSTLYIDFDGSGEKPYKVMKGFGSATPDFWGSTLEDVTVLILPWSE